MNVVQSIPYYSLPCLWKMTTRIKSFIIDRKEIFNFLLVHPVPEILCKYHIPLLLSIFERYNLPKLHLKLIIFRMQIVGLVLKLRNCQLSVTPQIAEECLPSTSVFSRVNLRWAIVWQALACHRELIMKIIMMRIITKY